MSGNSDDDRAGRRKAGDVVDVSIGLDIRETAAEPDHSANPEIKFETLLYRFTRELGIAVGIEQALLRREQGPLAVHMQRATFAHERRAIEGQARHLEHAAGKRRIVAVRTVFLAPGVEHPLNARSASLAVLEERRFSPQALNTH